VRETLQDMGTRIGQGYDYAKNDAWAPVQAAIDSASEAGARIDIQGLVEKLRGAITKAEAGASGTEGSMELATKLRGLLEHEFRRDVPSAPKLIPREVPNGMINPDTGLPGTKTVYDEVIPPPTRRDITSASPEEALRLRRTLATEAGITGRKAGATTQGGPINLTQAEKDVQRLATELSETLNGQLQGIFDEDALAANARFGYLRELEKEIDPLVKNPQTMFATNRNLDITSNLPRQGLFEEVDEALGKYSPGLMYNAPKFQALETFGPGRASTFSTLRNARSVPLGRVGGIFGMAAGGAAGYNASDGGAVGAGLGGSLGGALGAGLGALSGSPQAMKFFIQQAVRAGKLQDLLDTATPGMLPAIREALLEQSVNGLNPWENMQ